MSRTWIYTGKGWGKPKLDPARCAQSVSGHYSSRQCRSTPAVRRMVEGVEYGFCRLHDPVVVAEKHAARHKDWERESQRRNRRDAYNEATAALREAALNAIRKIAEGHNDPTALAREVLSKEPEPLK